MGKVGTYLRSFWQSIREKPIVFVIFIITIIMSVILSGFFYRCVKKEIVGYLGEQYYNIPIVRDIDSAQLYKDLANNDKIMRMTEEIEITSQTEEGDSERVYYSKQYSENSLHDVNYFTAEELASGRAIAIVDTLYAKKHDVNVGDKLLIGDVECEVIRKTSGNGIVIPANLKVNFDAQQLTSHRFIMYTKGVMSQEMVHIFARNNIVVKAIKFNTEAMWITLLGIIVVAVAALNIFVAYKFISSKNSHRYTLFKTMGAKSYDIAIMMALESFVCLIIAFVSGAVIEHFCATPMVGNSHESIASLTAVDYVYLFLINAFVELLTTTILIFKKVKSQPLDSKQRGLE